jgi:hypothetical protein
MNVNQLLKIIDLEYRSAATDADKIRYMNMAQHDLSRDFGTEVVDTTLVTVATQDYYTFPTGLYDIAQIIELDISTIAVPGRYDYTRYSIGNGSDLIQAGSKFFQITSSTGAKSLGIYPVPTTAGLTIRIRFRKRLTDLNASTPTQEPDFDNRFHDALAFFACHMICASGSSPDAMQADMFMQKYESSINGLRKLRIQDNQRNPSRYRDNRQWRRGK